MADISTKESPFSPGKPVQPEYFVAREKEIERLERAIRQALSGRNENLFISGQRGIGKSSLAAFIRHFAEKEYDFIGSHCFLGGVKGLDEMIGATFQQLLQDCADRSLFERLTKVFSDYITGLKLLGLGVEFTKDRNKLLALADNFLPALRKIYAEAKKNGKKGLLLILDDLNGITNVPEFSQFLKSFVDALATSGKPLPLLLLLVGLPERRVELIEHQPSVGRIFDVVDLPPLSPDESKDFFSSMFEKCGVTVADRAMSVMVKLSGGFPMLLHEVGDAVFWLDKDGHISQADAEKGITEAARIVGNKYVHPKISKVVRNETYSSILWRIGKKLPLGATFKRQELLMANAPEKERRNLDNFLGKIKKMGIMKDGEVRGEYMFVNPLYHLYIWYEAKTRDG